MNKKLLIILDPAHGEETPGKRSPDEKHREYLWSREQLKRIDTELRLIGYTVKWTNETNMEIGLSNRKNIASTLAKNYPGLTPFLISLHNDAVTAGPIWQDRATGISVWTSKGVTKSDEFAKIFIDNIPNFLPDIKQRIYSQGTFGKDFEENFTVLMGAYYAILIECMFQDNKADVEKLSDPEFKKDVIEWIMGSIDQCNEYAINKSI